MTDAEIAALNYERLCAMPAPEKVIACMTRGELRDLRAHILRQGVDGAIPTILLGLILCVAADRFLSPSPPQS